MGNNHPPHSTAVAQYYMGNYPNPELDPYTSGTSNRQMELAKQTMTNLEFQHPIHRSPTAGDSQDQSRNPPSWSRGIEARVLEEAQEETQEPTCAPDGNRTRTARQPGTVDQIFKTCHARAAKKTHLSCRSGHSKPGTNPHSSRTPCSKPTSTEGAWIRIQPELGYAQQLSMELETVRSRPNGTQNHAIPTPAPWQSPIFLERDRHFRNPPIPWRIYADAARRAESKGLTDQLRRHTWHRAARRQDLQTH